jgi:hypothetical protein
MSQSQSVQTMHMVLNILRLLRPQRIQGISKLRLGRHFDGGYVMLNTFRDVTAAYSLGINDDVSWDLDIANRGIPVFQYDHTITQLPATHKLFNWEKIGITAREEDNSKFQTVRNLVERNGHTSSSELILKCDIEGAEWEVFAAMPAETLVKFQQVIVEFHGFHRLNDPAFANLVRTAFANLHTNHRVIHVHANNFSPWISVGGIPLPTTLEITFARLNLGSFMQSDEIFPTALDMPCNPSEADFYLSYFVF